MKRTFKKQTAQMKQPDKTNVTVNKKNKKKIEKEKKQIVYKSQIITPTKEKSVKELFIRKNDTPKEKSHPEYGTSKLEDYFAKNFLKKLGLVYKTQFKAESIGRYYDFYIPSCNLLIEIDGDYYHSYNIVYENMSPMQKHNFRVDKDKDKWAKSHKMPLIRIWEHEIYKEADKVMSLLIDTIKQQTDIFNKTLSKKQRPIKNNN